MVWKPEGANLLLKEHIIDMLKEIELLLVVVIFLCVLCAGIWD